MLLTQACTVVGMDFLAEKRKEIENRLKELRPLVEEASKLEAALDALDGIGSPAARKSSSKTKRSRGSAKPRRSGSGKPGRPKGSGKRAAQALALVEAQPGISIPEMASQMGIHQNYLYRVLPGLQADGKVRKEGRGWHVAA